MDQHSGGPPAAELGAAEYIAGSKLQIAQGPGALPAPRSLRRAVRSFFPVPNFSVAKFFCQFSGNRRAPPIQTEKFIDRKID